MPSNKKVLFISHDAGRSGAPMVFLHFLRYCKLHAIFQPLIICLESGALIKEFEKCGKVIIWNEPVRYPRFYERIYTRIKSKILGAPVHKPLIEIISFQPDIIFSNTILSHKVANEIKKKTGAKWISYVHEMDYSIKARYSDFVTPNLIKNIDYVLAACQDIVLDFTEKYNVEISNITCVNEFIDIKAISSPTISALQIKKDLNLDNTFIVGGSGYFLWRKGIDLFLQLAIILNKTAPEKDIKFLWVGGIDHISKVGVDWDLEKTGLKGKVIFVGEQDVPQNYFQLFDIFFMSSKEDPFPLVSMEAAALGKPIMFFDKSGGMEEFVNDNTGYKLPYADLLYTADLVCHLYDNPEELNFKSNNIKKNVEKYDVSVKAPVIVNIINGLN